MKITNMLLLVCASVLVLSACSKKETDGIEANGSCKSETIASFNDAAQNGSIYNSSKSDYYMDKTVAACAAFKSLVGARSCSAIKKLDGKPYEISAATIAPYCSNAEADKITKEKNQP